MHVRAVDIPALTYKTEQGAYAKHCQVDYTW